MTRVLASLLLAALPAVALADPEPAPPQPEPTLAPAGGDKLPSTAIDIRKEEDSTRPSRFLLSAIEQAAVFGGIAGYYWATSDLQKADWDLDWSWDSWKQKLNGEGIRFDTNPMHVNMFGHTTQAVLTYHTVRGNGFGFTGATLINIAHSVLWEYFVEFREYPSLNDMIVNSVSGPALGEPLWQIGDYFRSGKKTWYNEGLAAFFQPLDEIERKVNRRKWRESARPWHRFEISAGTISDESGTGGVGDVDLEVISFDRSGARDGWTPAGGWSRLAGGLRFGDNGITGGHLYSRTSYGGYQSRAVYEDGIGRSMFLGFGTGITFESSDLGGDLEGYNDMFAAYHLIGPQADLRLRTKNFYIRWQAAAYGDLNMVRSHALAGMPPLDPEEQWSSPLTRPDGYYFGLGATAWTRLLVRSGILHADLEAHGHHVWSLDQKNADRGEPAPPHDLTDRRLFGQLKLGVDLYSGISLDGVLDLAERRGGVENDMMTRESTEQRYGLQLTLLR